MKNKIKEIVYNLGADVCGIANIDRFAEAPKGFHPTDIFTDCKSVIVFGVALPKGLLNVDPTVLYSHYNDFICQQVDRIALKTAKRIEEDLSGFAVPLPCDGPYEYWDSEKMEGRGTLSMKHAAVLAGLGCIGKSTLLLNVKYGTLLTIGAVLTNLDLLSDELAKNICKEGCQLCIENCPANALDGTVANQLKCRKNTYGKTARGFDAVYCNKCRAVCPMKYGNTKQ